MIVQVNGERRELPASTTLAQLIDNLKLAAERVAVEHNQSVIRRAVWKETVLSEGDRIEIVHFVGGGGPFNVQRSMFDVRNGTANLRPRTLGTKR